MLKHLIFLCLLLPVTLFAQSKNTEKSAPPSGQVKIIKKLVKDCSDADLTTRESAANRLMDFPIDWFPKKSIQRIKKALNDEELINFQLILLVGYLQMKDQAARLESFIKPAIDSENHEFSPEFTKEFTFDSKQWAAHLALARMETEEYMIHSFFIFEEFYIPSLKKSEHFFTLMEHYAYANQEEGFMYLCDLLEEEEELFYLFRQGMPPDQEKLMRLKNMVKELFVETTYDPFPKDVVVDYNFQFLPDFPFFYNKITPNNFPRITYPPLQSRIKIDMDTLQLLKKGMTYFNTLSDHVDAIRFLKKNSIRANAPNDSIYWRTAMLLGKVYLKNKQIEKALAHFDDLLNWNPPNPRLYIGKKYICYLLADSLLAWQEFDRAITYIRLLRYFPIQNRELYHDPYKGVRRRELAYFVGIKMLDSTLLYTHQKLLTHSETHFAPTSLKDIVGVIKTKYSKMELEEMVNNTAVFRRKNNHFGMGSFVTLFGLDFPLYDKTLYQQRNTLSEEELIAAYDAYFRQSKFIQLLLED